MSADREPGNSRLLLSAARVAALDPELGDDWAREVLGELLASVSSTMVDVATGQDRPLDGATAGRGYAAVAADRAAEAARVAQAPAERSAIRASCSATAAELVRAGRTLVAHPSAARSAAARSVATALDRLAVLLQDHAQQEDPTSPAARQRLRRGLRAAASAALLPATVPP